jgi:catechol 2,3-dioxygenase-like lactoylglutathione lyase family enzyme
MTDAEIVQSEQRVSRRSFIKRALAAGATASASGYLVGGSGALAQAPAGIRSFDHVALPMQNTEAMVSFYRALGCQVREGTSVCSVHFRDQKINFHRPEMWKRETFRLRAPAARPPCGDLCFVWEGTPEALTATLDKTGAKIIEGPVRRDGGRNGGKDVGTSVYVRDPDGNLLEFMIYA